MTKLTKPQHKLPHPGRSFCLYIGFHSFAFSFWKNIQHNNTTISDQRAFLEWVNCSPVVLHFLVWEWTTTYNLDQIENWMPALTDEGKVFCFFFSVPLLVSISYQFANRAANSAASKNRDFGCNWLQIFPLSSGQKGLHCYFINTI